MDSDQLITYRYLVKNEEYYFQVTTEYLRNTIHLQPGEELCNGCGGAGFRYISEKKVESCIVCKGEKKINWIQRIFNNKGYSNGEFI